MVIWVLIRVCADNKVYPHHHHARTLWAILCGPFPATQSSGTGCRQTLVLIKDLAWLSNWPVTICSQLCWFLVSSPAKLGWYSFYIYPRFVLRISMLIYFHWTLFCKHFLSPLFIQSETTQHLLLGRCNTVSCGGHSNEAGGCPT